MTILETLFAHSRTLLVHLEPCLTFLGPYWAIVRHFGTLLGHIGTLLRHFRTLLLGHLETIFGGTFTLPHLLLGHQEQGNKPSDFDEEEGKPLRLEKKCKEKGGILAKEAELFNCETQ